MCKIFERLLCVVCFLDEKFIDNRLFKLVEEYYKKSSKDIYRWFFIYILL